MANQTGIRVLLDELKQRIEAYQQARKMPLGGSRKALQGHGGGISAEDSLEEYAGPPLEIGNELLITDKIVKKYHGLSNALGRVVIIDQISPQENKAIKASAFGIQVDVEMKVAEQMRQAYLRREQAWSPT